MDGVIVLNLFLTLDSYTSRPQHKKEVKELDVQSLCLSLSFSSASI